MKKEPAELIEYIVLDAVLSAFGYSFQQMMKDSENPIHEQLFEQALSLLEVMSDELEIDETKINPINLVNYHNFKKIKSSFEAGEFVQLEIVNNRIH